MPSNEAIWEKIYEGGHCELAPWDEVISFVYAEKPKKTPAETRILELGCGTGPNLVFLAKQGFQTSGCDLSVTALDKAIDHFQREDIQSYDLRRSDFRQVPWSSETFDMVLDRAALWYVDRAGIAQAISEAHRVLKPGGKFFFTPCRENVNTSTGKITFFKTIDIYPLLPQTDWEIKSLRQVTLQDCSDHKTIVSYYRCIAQKRN